MLSRSLAALALLACTSVAANAAGDPVKGAQVYKRCAICHTDQKGGANGLGPNLFGIVGQKAATRPGFSYSPVLKNSKLVWTEANLGKWIASPGRMLPGNKMMFSGITSKKQQADLIAYLASKK